MADGEEGETCRVTLTVNACCDPSQMLQIPGHDTSMLELLVYLVTCGSCVTLLYGDLLKPL